MDQQKSDQVHLDETNETEKEEQMALLNLDKMS